MNYYFTGILIVLFCLLAIFVKPAHSDTTQNNTSGSNTNITGGYDSTSNTTYQSGSSSNTTSNSTSNSNIKSAPPTASAPSFSAQSQDVCATGVSVGIQTFGTGFSGGKTNRDMNCERIKLAKVLYDFGMKVGSVALLCQDERVFEAMINAGTPCPVDGKIGKEALKIWNRYEFERPDYDTYVKRIKKREVIDNKINKEEAKKLELHTK
jgi:hypothetical protein|tara:strand:- start:235 stop:861 length:627 start_codon:yes stop_codon:yes gene_type:complete